nr:MAG TPA: hypothetical protein [Caudoviricetes sp.]
MTAKSVIPKSSGLSKDTGFCISCMYSSTTLPLGYI